MDSNAKNVDTQTKMRLFKEALKLIKEDKILHFSDSENFGTMYLSKSQLGEVDTRLVKKPGRTLVHCGCENGVRFCKEPALCKHKIASIVLEFLKINNLTIKWD